MHHWTKLAKGDLRTNIRNNFAITNPSHTRLYIFSAMTNEYRGIMAF